MFRNLTALLDHELSKRRAMRDAHGIHEREWRYSYKNYWRSARYCVRALECLAAIQGGPYPC